VIANFEVPSELTQESLGKTGADAWAPLTLVDDELVPNVDDRLRWRIWNFPPVP
jgi:hypothetical protein